MGLGKWLGGLFGGGSDAGSASKGHFDAEEHKGFLITPAPTQRDGQWQVAGTISRDDADGTCQEHAFIRADLLPSADQAAEFALRKGRQIIDEQGERLFG